MNAKRILTSVIFMSGIAAMTHAQSTSRVGPWSIYSVSVNGKTSVLLQTSALQQNDRGQDASNVTTLNVLCKNNKLQAVALHTTSGIDSRDVSYVTEFPTMPVVASIEGRIDSSENWAVSEKGHTLSPYSEIIQGRLNRQWLRRLNTAHTVSFRIGRSDGAEDMEPTFDTKDLSEALSSAGCAN